mmetsp:Transcript_120163/g.340131  ORF Transcript_120163/g.340131 Transcript_120163/m.340131 type:complete len:211 (+) Transcript_120163:3059-3691(+)
MRSAQHTMCTETNMPFTNIQSSFINLSKRTRRISRNSRSTRSTEAARMLDSISRARRHSSTKDNMMVARSKMLHGSVSMPCSPSLLNLQRMHHSIVKQARKNRSRLLANMPPSFKTSSVVNPSRQPFKTTRIPKNVSNRAQFLAALWSMWVSNITSMSCSSRRTKKRLSVSTSFGVPIFSLWCTFFQYARALAKSVSYSFSSNSPRESKR